MCILDYFGIWVDNHLGGGGIIVAELREELPLITITTVLIDREMNGHTQNQDALTRYIPVPYQN